MKIQQSNNDGMRMTRDSEELLFDQKGGGDHQHVEERGNNSHDKPDEKTAWVSDTGGRPSRKKTPSIRYSAPEFDLS